MVAGKTDAETKAAVTRWLSLAPDEKDAVLNYIRTKPAAVLQIPAVRSLLAQMRIEKLQDVDIRMSDGDRGDLVTNAIEHNLDGLKAASSLIRPTVLVQPLLSIGTIQRRIREMEVLTIGPRTEAELFALYAIGFNPSKITGLDLISYSPMVDVGDMHAMPYADDSFDVIIVGWVLVYSSNQEKAIREILRVARPGAIIAVGCEYSVQNEEAQAERMASMGLERRLDDSEFNTVWSEERILGLFGDSVARVHFVSDDSKDPDVDLGGVIVIFQIA